MTGPLAADQLLCFYTNLKDWPVGSANFSRSSERGRKRQEAANSQVKHIVGDVENPTIGNYRYQSPAMLKSHLQSLEAG